MCPAQEPAGATVDCEHRLDLAKMHLAFSLTRPFMTPVTIGATSMEQLRTNTTAKDVVLSADVLKGIALLHKEFPAPI